MCKQFYEIINIKNNINEIIVLVIALKSHVSIIKLKKSNYLAARYEVRKPL